MSIPLNSLTLNCNAKINLALDVISKRPDGYHDVELIFNEIPVFDTVTVSLRKDGKITLSCSDKTVPIGEDALSYRGAVAFFKATGLSLGADISIINNIPNGAGLAGASTDVAGVLKALNRLTGNPLSLEELMKIGGTLGADVPFCIMGGCALAEGIGEILTPLPLPPKLYYVIAKPKESVSTAWVYQNLSLDNRPKDLCVPAVAEGIRKGDLEMIVKNTGNILEAVTAKAIPVIYDIKHLFTQKGAIISMMSGSGTSVFGAFEEKASAIDAAEAVKIFTDKIYIV